MSEERNFPKDKNTMDVCLMNEVLESYPDQADRMDACFRYGQLVSMGVATGDTLKNEIIGMIMDINSKGKLEDIRSYIMSLM